MPFPNVVLVQWLKHVPRAQCRLEELPINWMRLLKLIHLPGGCYVCGVNQAGLHWRYLDWRIRSVFITIFYLGILVSYEEFLTFFQGN